MDIPHTPECFASHLGPWLMHTDRFAAAARAWMSGDQSAVRASVGSTGAAFDAVVGAWEHGDGPITLGAGGAVVVPSIAGTDFRAGEAVAWANPMAVAPGTGGTARAFDMVGAIAIIPIAGQMMKGESSMGGTSTVMTRRAIRAAVADDDVAALLLHIDSPGGHVAGTDELGAEVRAADAVKPVFAHASDMMASAALWIGTQARRVTANRMAEIGSIGAFTVITDSSGAAEAAGIKVHVVGSGPFKGVGAPGVEVSDAAIEHVQELIDGMGAAFVDAVAAGRNMSASAVKALADGRSWLAADALALGLIDAVQGIEETVADIEAEIERVTARGRAATARAGLARSYIDDAGDVLR